MKSAVVLLCSLCLLTPVGVLAASKKPAKPAEKTAAEPSVPAPTVAVLYFDYDGKDPDLAMLKKGLAQMVISDLSGVQQVRIVERDRLQALIAELKLQRTSRFDKKTAARLGRLLGARFLVLGAYFQMMGTLRIDARVVAVESGEIIKSVGVNGKQDDFIGLEQKLTAGLAAILSGPLPPPPKRVAERHRKRKKAGKSGSSAPPASTTASERPAPRRQPATPPKQLDTKAAIDYAKALDAKDNGDIVRARQQLKSVIKARPDFVLAQLDLASLGR